MQSFTREEMDRRLRDADRARLALRRATRELAALGHTLLEQRRVRRVGTPPARRPDATGEPTA